MPQSTTPPVGVQEPVLRVQMDEGIVTLTLNRPAKLNSLAPELGCRLADAWEQMAADPAVRVVIVTGAGDRAFCTGADLGRLIPLFTGARPAQDEWDQRLQSDPRLLDKALLRRTDYTVPVIAAVHGVALGGGIQIALGADSRIVAPDGLCGSAACGLSANSSSHAPSCGSVRRPCTSPDRYVICSARYSPAAAGIIVRSSQPNNS